MPGKFLGAILLPFTYVSLFGQGLTEREKEKLTGLEIDHNQLLEEKPDYGKDLKRILEKDRKYRRNKTVGIVLKGLGLATTVGGILIMAQKDGNGLSRTIVGAGTTALGLIEIGTSIPLFTSSKKRKKERDKMISEVNTQSN